MDAHVGNDNKISSPMPAIGLYMAVATLVCLILMLCDVFNAIRQKKPVNKLTLVAIRIARDFFALTIEKTGIVDGLRLSKGGE
ncbi:hypothetical protein Syun_030593 [Stephania yunnanensis]|uniref:Uncharacterized protein n=1 Tax=Stephania yunnanensis TaxID=152371 RepID=A0AAP0DXH3_9MAGN